MKLLEVSSTEMLVFITDSFTCIRYSMNSNGKELEQVRIDTSNIAPEQLAERVCLTKSQLSLLIIYFRLSVFQC